MTTVLSGALLLLLMLLQAQLLQQRPLLVVSRKPLQRSRRAEPFPAVAICSYNVISRRALSRYAARLASLDKNGTFTLAEIEINLRAFGALQTHTTAPFHLRFTSFLAALEGRVNVTNVMLQLAPSCASQLLSCAWRGRPIPCGRLFEPRLTGNGFCCVTNARHGSKAADPPSETSIFVGEEQGLVVVVKGDPTDVSFLRRPSHDIEVTLFDGRQYPLTEMSGVRSYPVPHNASVYMKLRFEEQHPAPQLRFYSEESRQCRMPGQGEAACVAGCRRSATLALCSCVPYTLLPEPHHTVCSPEHLPCLYKHREKLTYFMPRGSSAAHESLARERTDGVQCECAPDCSHFAYSARLQYVQREVALAPKLFVSRLLKDVSLANSTVIRIFYANQEDHVAYVLEPNQRYYEDVAMVGSQVALVCFGVLPAALALLFHCTVRWRHHYLRR